MATFVTHSAVGAGFRGTLASLAGLSSEWRVLLLALGALEGASPDALDWLLWKFFGADRWSLYKVMHSSPACWWGLLFWGWGLHVLLDKPFHRTPGENWWPRLWWLEILSFLVGALLIWYTFKGLSL